MTPRPAADRLAAAFLAIGRERDRFERGPALAAVLADEARRADLAVTRALERTTVPVLAFLVGFGAACALCA